jgi:DNA-binding beta-propeller fold protein YncE
VQRNLTFVAPLLLLFTVAGCGLEATRAALRRSLPSPPPRVRERPPRPASIGFLRTGAGAHGLYPSRDARVMYVSNRGAGTVSVVSFASGRVIARWVIPPPASPDMGGVSADGRVLWLSGRYNSEVYAIDTRTGRLQARIPIGAGPHGLCVWPQPGRLSLGHTGITR